MVGGRGGSAKSDFISNEALIKHLMRGGGGVKKGQKSSDVIYGRPLAYIIALPNFFSNDQYLVKSRYLGQDFYIKDDLSSFYRLEPTTKDI